MAKIADIPKIDRPREKFLKKGPELLSTSELLAIVIGSGIKGKNAQQLAKQIITKFGKNFLNVTVNDLKRISGIGEAKALLIISAIALVKRFYDNNKINENSDHFVREKTLFDLFEIEKPIYKVNLKKADKGRCFQMQNRRYLGNKYKLLGFIEDIILEKCGVIESFCDIFAGTGIVGERFNNKNIKIISNDFLVSNYVCLKTFLETNYNFQKEIFEKIEYLNELENIEENYFSEHFGKTYFTHRNAKKIGKIREEIDKIANNENQKNILLCSLLYAVDKVANTVGHYDAFRKNMDMLQHIKLLIPNFNYQNNDNNKIYKENSNQLIRKITCDVLYIDPPYNSRQYSDTYHLLENLIEWKKPEVIGIGKKMNREHIKSDYCLKNATDAFSNLIENADCQHILLSYNNTGTSKDSRSNARISDNDIMQILNEKGEVEIFEKNFKAFTTGKSLTAGNAERIFYCKVTK